MAEIGEDEESSRFPSVETNVDPDIFEPPVTASESVVPSAGEPAVEVDPDTVEPVDSGSSLPRYLLIYGVLLLLVVVGGGMAIWALVEKRQLHDSLAPDPLPKPILVTDAAESEGIASWVRLFTEASFSPVVVPAAQFDNSDGGVLVIAETDLPIDPLPSSSLVILGRIPEWLEASVGTRTTEFETDQEFAPTPTASPVLARVETNQTFRHAKRAGWAIEENAEMNVDVRWSDSSRPAVAHWTSSGRRIVWIGFDPRHLWQRQNRQLQILMRAAFRWVDGQPISEGAAGSENAAMGFEPAARTAARGGGLAFSVDRTQWPEVLSVRIRNGGDEVLENPSIRIWLPPGVRGAKLRGSVFQTRYVTLIPEDEKSVVLTLPSLAPGSERLLSLDTTR